MIRTNRQRGAVSCRQTAARLMALPSIFLWCSLPAAASEDVSRAGHGHYTVGYQRIHVDGFEGSQGEIPIGTVDTHSLYFEVDYNLTDRWSMVAGIPYIIERYLGDFPHDPLLLDPPRPDVENVDQGAWNAGFQDFHLGARYLLKSSGQLRIEPYVLAGIPSNDYPFFGHAAFGQNLVRVELGSNFTYIPPLSDAYFQLELGYAFVEKTLGTSISHWNIRAEAGYFFGPRLSGRLFLLHKDGRGLIFPDDFPPPRTDEKWFQHDRMIQHNFTNFGAGLDWALDDTYQVSTSVLTMVRAEQVHNVDYAFTLGLTRSF